MNGDLISIIIPAYNNAPWLPRCLDSVLAQTYENLEIIPVDDGSSDETYTIMQDYASRDGRIKPVHKENGGVTSARFAGIAASTGQWIGFVDGDDEIESQMYARLLENAYTYGADISHCGFTQILPGGEIVYHHNTGVIRQQDTITALRDLLKGDRVEPGLWNKLYRRELLPGLEEKMDFSIRINEDFLMNFYLFSQAKTAVWEDVCPYHYIARVGSASRRKMNVYKIYDPIRVRQKVQELCPDVLKEDALRAKISMCLYSYAMLTLEGGREPAMHRQKVRELLLAEKDALKVTSRRNAVLIWMVQYTPWLFRVLYPVYFQIFEKKVWKRVFGGLCTRKHVKWPLR